LIYIDPSGHDAIIITAEEGAYNNGHTSSIVEDENGDWYYYFWGDTKVTVTEVPDECMVSLDAFNEWISLGAKNGEDGFHQSQYYHEKYTDAIYIEGDFTESLDYYNIDVKVYNKNYSKDDNGDYGVFRNNCVQRTITGLKKGVATEREITGGGMIPNSVHDYMKYSLQNSSFTYKDYLMERALPNTYAHPRPSRY